MVFVKEILNPYLGNEQIHLQPILPEGGGGNINFERVRKDIANALSSTSSSRGRNKVFVSTAFDYYGIDSDWPGVDAIKKKFDSGKKLSPIEIGDTLKEATAKHMKKYLKEEKKSNIDMSRFIPYFQVHEFEALLFSDLEKLAEVIGAGSTAVEINKRIQENAPEEINDNKETSPSQRIHQLFREKKKRYDKTSTGIAVAGKIKVQRMYERCPNFKKWVDELKKLPDT